MSKKRGMLWIILLLGAGAIAAWLYIDGGSMAATGFASYMAVQIICYLFFCAAAFLLGRSLEKQFGLEKRAAVFLVVIAVVFVGMIGIFYRGAGKAEQIREEQGTIAPVSVREITAEELGLQPQGAASIDSGEDYWKSWLEYTAMLENGGSLEYSCERFSGETDADKRLSSYIESDLTSAAAEWSRADLALSLEGTSVTCRDAYEWVTGEDAGMRVFRYYFIAGDMVLQVKYRNEEPLNGEQLAALTEWFAKAAQK